MIEEFIKHVKQLSSNEEFVHHKWFVIYHLEIVDKIAMELCDKYPEADRDFVRVLVWIHDYGKMIDFDNQYELTLTKGKEKLTEIGFEHEFVDRIVKAMQIIDKKDIAELESSTIEIKIVSSADGASHHVGPFYFLILYENPDKPMNELLKGNLNKTNKDWDRKIVLPEVKEAFEQRHNFVLEQNGELPDKYLT